VNTSISVNIENLSGVAFERALARELETRLAAIPWLHGWMHRNSASGGYAVVIQDASHSWPGGCLDVNQNTPDLRVYGFNDVISSYTFQPVTQDMF
jgi:hypothetical protein